jgi:uncharacterized membrane protein
MVGKNPGMRSSKKALLAPAIVWALIACAIALYSSLAILRHETFGSSAMDLGYTDQVVWNTLHGRFLRFSTYENARIDLPQEQFRRTDILLAYHVELLLVPISLLYLVLASPITLLLLQSVFIPLGAWPAFRLAREHLDSDLAGVVVAWAYLLAPAVEGAILSDFHAVALTAPLLLFAFYSAEKRKFAACFLLLVLAMLAKEDIPLVVFTMGLYLGLVRRQYRIGAALAGAGLLWFLVCTMLILPHYSGLSRSPFTQRLAIFGSTPEESALNALRQPRLLLQWLARPGIISYLGGLLASGGGMSFFAPLVLMLAAPLVVINVFSTWSWTYSEGAHYSIAIIPFVIVSAVYGLGNLRDLLCRRFSVSPSRTITALSLIVLVVGTWHHHEIGVSPLGKGFRFPQVTSHHRLGHALIELIPAEAPLSAQSNLYPHVAHRQKAYFFPAVNDADYVFLDVTSSPYPLDNTGLQLSAQRLLWSGEFGVLAAQDGYLLLQRGLASDGRGVLPGSFYTFAQVEDNAVPRPKMVMFGEKLELVGYDWRALPSVQSQDLPVTITTYWRALAPLDQDYRFAFFFTDVAIVFLYDQDTPTTCWYPPQEWPVGDVIRMETPVLTVGRLRDVLVAVTPPDQSPWEAGSRLRPKPTDGQEIQLADQDTLVRLFTFPK